SGFAHIKEGNAMQIQEIQSTYSQLAPLMEIAINEKPKRNAQDVAPGYRQEASDQTKSSFSRSSLRGNSRTMKDLDVPSADTKRVRIKINDSQRAIVSIVDGKTNEVISEMPPEQVLEMLDKLELNPGALVDREA
ncbi:MAG: flagellar protein FlaG, partial [bacterium]